MKHQTDILDAQISQGRVQIKYGFTDDETEKEYLLELIYKQYFQHMQKLGYYPDAQIIEGEDETIIEAEHEIWNSFAKEYQDFTFSAEITKVIEDSLWGTANEVLELALEEKKMLKKDDNIVFLSNEEGYVQFYADLRVNPHRGGTYEQLKYYQNLFCAAPQLLEALEKLVSEYQSTFDFNVPEIIVAKTAIAAAKGEI